MVDSGMNCYGDGGHPAVEIAVVLLAVASGRDCWCIHLLEDVVVSVDTEIVFGMDWWGNYLCFCFVDTAHSNYQIHGRY